ncbi:hypothetical protein K9K85_01510 [Patescibacteria group bacterium]|nr:hypothetical protein [Patescibacteria group bacterium]
MPKVYISPHQKIGQLFLILTALTIGGIIFGFFSLLYGAEIIITPQVQDIDTNLTLSVREIEPLDVGEEKENYEPFILGEFVEIMKEGEFDFSPQSNVSVEDYAEGLITVKNNTWNSVTFVVSTRFASPEGLIFRAVERIFIPARGETEVLVRADKVGAAYDIEPCNFTIPNLTSPSLKENISAWSEKSMSGGIKTTGVIMQSDIEQAQQEVREQFYEQATKDIKEIFPASSNFKIALRSEIVEENINAQAGEEKGEFTVATKMKIQAVAFSEEKVMDLALSSLKDKVENNKQLVAYEPESLSYRLISYNFAEKNALLEVQVRGLTTLSPQNEILDETLFFGMNQAEAQQYLEELPEIQEAKIKFWPSWLVKKFPTSKNRIKIRYEEKI